MEIKPCVPQSALIVGCGLMGTSFALALQRLEPSMALFGVEVNPLYREQVTQLGCFQHVYTSLEQAPHAEWVILAVPSDVACNLFPQAMQYGKTVIDICSVKQPVCDAALNCNGMDFFIPTHPMTGLSTLGPQLASADLFVGQPWLVVQNECVPAEILGNALTVLRSIGSHVLMVPSAKSHDEAMAAVSHGVHLSSVAVMLGFQSEAGNAFSTWSRYAGPAFRDVTRISGTDPSFWVSTLLANGEQVIAFAERVQQELAAVQLLLRDKDEVGLRAWLQSGATAHRQYLTTKVNHDL